MEGALLSFLVNELGSVIKQEIEQEVRLVVGVRNELKKLESTFKTLQAVLNDAERRQMNDVLVKMWLDKLKNAAYEMEDVLDEWGTEIQRARLEKLQQHLVYDGKNMAKKYQVSSSSSYLCSPVSCFKKIALRRDIGFRIKEIRKTLDSIKNERDQFNFIASIEVLPEDSYTRARRETSFIMVDPDIWGRDTDKNIILNKLFGTKSTGIQQGDPRIISIIGMGGLGKTTLAQLVFNDANIKTHFQLPMWVCVPNPFDLTLIAKAIIREATKKDTTSTTWNALHTELCESVNGKKFLLVLDDFWTEDPNNWDPLKHLLNLGTEGSRILVTTRSDIVASRINSCKHILQVLSSSDSFSLLHRKAFLGKENEENNILKEICNNIASKCDGLPLALSLLGSLLNNKVNERLWRHVLESKIWELKGFDHSQELMNPAFLLSYDGLSSPLKNCFAYCSVFQKGQNIRKRTLINLWMAQGFLNSADKTKVPELTGEEYFVELAVRSFFQDFSVDEDDGQVFFKMHDLVHEFAQYLAKNYCYVSYNNEDTFCLNQASTPIHLTLIYDERDVGPNSFYGSVRKVDNIRTVQCMRHKDHSFSVGNISSDLMHHLRCIRVLKLKGMGVTHIPDDIDKLIHLRYLDLSKNIDLDELPESMCNLLNLQVLKLKDCRNLFKLPKGMGRMINLRNFDIRYSGLEYMPKGIGYWNCLHNLSTFIVCSTERKVAK